jgi:hypothetical protein
MKKLYTILILFLLLTISSKLHAQNLGIKAGLNIASVKAQDKDEVYSDDLSSRVGQNLGVVLELPISDEVFVQGGLLFSGKGWKNNDEGYGYHSKLSLNYLDIPVYGLYKYELDDIYIFGLTGPQIGLGLFGKYSYDDDSDNVEWNNEDNFDSYKRPELSWIFGAGVEINEMIQLSLAYNVGLTSIATYTEYDYVEKNRILQLTAVLLLNDLEIF